MFTPSLQSKFVTKIVTARDGREYRVVFLVALLDGEIKARIVSAVRVRNNELGRSGRFGSEPQRGTSESLQARMRIRNYESGTNKQYYLSGFSAKQPKTEENIPCEQKLTSPYLTLEFFMSQPTRAPSRSV